jgi:hypothetical protein
MPVMSETGAEDDQRLGSVAETIREGHEAAAGLADKHAIDPDAETPTPGEGEDVEPGSTPEGRSEPA